MAYTGTRTSDDYEPLVIFAPDGAERRASVYRKRSPERATMSLPAARDGLDAGQPMRDTLESRSMRSPSTSSRTRYGCPAGDTPAS